MKLKILKGQNILKITVENDAEKSFLLANSVVYGNLSEGGEDNTYLLEYNDFSAIDLLKSSMAHLKEKQEVQSLIDTLITSDDTAAIVDRHNRALDVIVVREVVEYLRQEEPVLADILLNFQTIGRDLNKYIMNKMREEKW